jgi:transcriptional regulator with XRE-family HTH domain
MTPTIDLQHQRGLYRAAQYLDGFSGSRLATVEFSHGEQCKQENLSMPFFLALHEDTAHKKLASMSIHEKIKTLRKAAKLSQLALAERVTSYEPSEPPITRQTVQHWEAGSTAPKRTRLPAVAAALGTTVTDLMSGTPGGQSSEAMAAPLALQQALEVLGQALARGMPDKQRTELAEALSTWARYEGRDTYRTTVTALLAEPSAMPDKRQANG